MGFEVGAMVARFGLDHRGFTTGLKTMQKQTKVWQKQVVASQKTILVMQKNLRRLTGTMGKLGAVMGGMTFGLMAKSVIQTGASFERMMNVVRGVSGLIGTEGIPMFEKMTSVVKHFGETTEFTSTQVAEGLKFLAMAGLEAETALKVLPKTLDLATAGQISLAEAADISTNIMTQMRLEVEDLNKVNDTLVKVQASSNTTVREAAQAWIYAGTQATLFKVEVQELGAMIGLLANAGIKGTMAGTTLRQAMIKLLNPSREAGKVLRKYGIELRDANGEIRSFTEMLLEMSDAGMDVQQTTKILGARAGNLAAIMALGSKEIKNYIRVIDEATGISQRLADLFRKDLTGQWHTFRSAVEGVSLELFGKFRPDLEKLLKDSTRWVRANKDEIVDWFVTTKGALSWLLDFAKQTAPYKEGLLVYILTRNVPLALAATALADIVDSLQKARTIQKLVEKGFITPEEALTVTPSEFFSKYLFGIDPEKALIEEGKWREKARNLRLASIKSLNEEMERGRLEEEQVRVEAEKKRLKTLLDAEIKKRGILVATSEEALAILEWVTEKELGLTSAALDTRIRKVRKFYEDKASEAVNSIKDEKTLLATLERLQKLHDKDIDKLKKDFAAKEEKRQERALQQRIKRNKEAIKLIESEAEELEALAETDMILLEARLRASVSAAEKRFEAEKKANDKTIEDAKKANEQKQKDYDHFMERVQDTTENTFYDIFTGAIESWSDLMDRMLDYFKRLLAQMLAEAIARPIIVPIMQSFGGAIGLPMGGGGLGGVAQQGMMGTGVKKAWSWLGGLGAAGHTGEAAALADFWTVGGAQGTAGYLSMAAPYLGAAGLGALGYTSLGPMLGLPQGKYSGIGAGLGAGIGMLAGPFGALAGSVLGGALGSLFGGSKPKKPRFGGMAELDVGAGGLLSTDVSDIHHQYSGDWGPAMKERITTLLEEYATAVNTTLADYGDYIGQDLKAIPLEIDFGWHKSSKVERIEKAVMKQLEEGLAGYSEALAKSFGFASLVAFEEYVAKMRAAGIASAQIIGQAFRASLDTGDWASFEQGVKESIYNMVLDGMVNAMLQSAMFQRALQPFFMSLDEAFEKAMETDEFDVEAFRRALTPELEGLTKTLGVLKPLFEAVYGVVGEFKTILLPELPELLEDEETPALTPDVESLSYGSGVSIPGLLTAHGGLVVPPQLGMDERLIVGQVGERILSTQEYSDLGGETGIQGAMAGDGGGTTMNFNFSAEVITTDDAAVFVSEMMEKVNQYRIGRQYAPVEVSIAGMDI